MTPKAAGRGRRTLLDPVRERAGKILLRWRRGRETIEELIESETDASPLDSMARARMRELLFGCMHSLGRHEFVLRRHAKRGSKLPDAAWVSLVLALQELTQMRTPDHAAVDQAVLLCRRLGAPHAARFVNGVLRSSLRAGLDDGLPESTEDAVAHAVHALSHPEWIVRRWAAELGEDEMLRLCAANNQRPHLVLRCVPGGREGIAEELSRLGVECVTTRVPDGLRLTSRMPAPLLLEELGGRIAIQDEAAQCVAPLLVRSAPTTVVDLCAAPGGKACHLAQLLPDARVLALDPSARRLERLVANVKRLGLRNVQAAVSDGRVPPLATGSVDAVLLDAPCSGTGVMARRHDLRWRRRETDLTRLQNLQAELLDSAATLLRPGGVLVYSTCSLETEENELAVDAALARHPFLEEIGIEPSEIGMDTAADVSFVQQGRLRAWPQLHGCDGAFAARLRRRA